MRRKSILGEVRRLRARLAPTAAERRHSHVGPADLWYEKRAFQIGFLRQMGLMPRHRLLDVGCGTLRGGIPLIEYLDPGNYFGVEAREPVLEEGRKELRESGLDDKRPTLIVGSDFAAIRLDVEFDFVWAYSVLIHMSDELMRPFLRFAAEHLAAEGAIYANVNIGTKGRGRWKEFPIMWHPLAFYVAEAAAVNLSVEDLGSLDALDTSRASSDLKGPGKQRMLRFRR